MTTLRETWQKKLDIKTYNITYNIQNIPGTHVKVDDMLSEVATMEKVLSIFRKVLVRCREINIKLARHKLEFVTEVDFASTHIGGLDGDWPTTAKINTIINLLAPTNLTELRLFLGCWNQLRHYIPDY